MSGSSVYVAGSFQSATAAFGGLALTNADGSARTYDAFVTKLTDAGSTATFAWAQRAGGGNSDFANAVAVSGPSVYVTGRFSSPLAAFGSAVLANAAAGAVSHDAFVTKLLDNGSTGSFAWAQRAGGADDEYFFAVAANGPSVYVTGYFSSASVDFGGTTLTNTAYGSVGDVCVARLTDSGTGGSFDWVQQAGGTGDDGASSIALHGNRVYVGGSFQNAARFGAIALTGTATPGNPSAFLAVLVDGPLPTLNSSTPGSGAIGSTLALTGTNLTGATRISFAGSTNPAATAGFAVNAAGTQISGIVVPAGATTGSVSVTTPVGQSNGVRFVVTNPAPLTTGAWQSATLPVFSTSSYARILATVADAGGNVFVTGKYQGAVRFGNTLLFDGRGGGGGFVAKWNPASGFVWAQSMAGNAGSTAARALALHNGNVYVVGDFSGDTVRVGSTMYGVDATGLGRSSLFVAKLTDAGSTSSVAWVQVASGSFGVRGLLANAPMAIAANATGVYVAGSFRGAAIIGTSFFTSVGTSDAFVAKLTDAGNSARFDWAFQAGDAGENAITALVANGPNMYLAGFFGSFLSLGATTLTSAGSTDAFVAKLTITGPSVGYDWAVSGGGPGADGAQALALTGPNLYVVGDFGSATANFGSLTLANTGTGGTTDAFAVKLTDAGSSAGFAWAVRGGGPGNDTGTAVAATGPNVYLAGGFAGTTATFGSTTLANTGTSTTTDAFVARLTDAGSSAGFAWAVRGGGPGNDVARGLAVRSGPVYAVGSFEGIASFAPFTLAALGTSNGFLAAVTDPALVSAVAVPAPPREAPAVYPNPAHGTTTVRLPAGSRPGPLVLLDALGREVRRYPAPASTEATLDLHGLPAGVYVLRSAASSQRLVVE